MSTMKAAVIHEAGGPEVLKIERIPIPVPQKGEVLIRVKAFGLTALRGGLRLVLTQTSAASA
jgi:D-arabinose 1-dehydrogenase-like Zn-dependent alcohol dehydrogenase